MLQIRLVVELTSVIMAAVFMRLGFHVSAYCLQIGGPTEVGNVVLVNMLIFIGSPKLQFPRGY